MALMMTLPVEQWLTSRPNTGELTTHLILMDLAERGLILSDPSPKQWSDLLRGEQTLAQSQWLDLAAVYHAHSGWRDMHGDAASQRQDEEANQQRLQELLRVRGEPPSHFEHRADTDARMSLDVPALGGPFFEALLMRHTTRAYQSHVPLPRSALEVILFAVFGTHGIRHLASGISMLKRTSPSAGSLHPIEAYVLAVNVQDVGSGLYHYETATHALAQLESMDKEAARKTAYDFTAGQPYFAEAHALFVHVARFDRNFWKYSRHSKAYKTVLMDSAHLSQTLYLTASHLGLGAFYTAAINDIDIARRLRLRPLLDGAIGINGVGIADHGRQELDFVPEPYQPTGIA
jgi:putative peptide maturation dehydrogenase